MATALSPTAGPILTSPSQRAPNRTHLPPNVSNVVLGNLHIKPWYPSFYPEDMLGGKKKVDWLYVCQWCFRYTTEVLGICGHCVCISVTPSAEGRREEVWVCWLTCEESLSLER